MRKRRLMPVYYLDTSVTGGCFDDVFREATRSFWGRLENGGFLALFSRLTLEELDAAPPEVRRLVTDLSAEAYRVVEVADDALELADRYLVEGVVGAAYRNDAVHVAVATVNNVKAIISWNYKHLVNLRRIEAFNGVNLLLGYRPIDIRTPMEVSE